MALKTASQSIKLTVHMEPFGKQRAKPFFNPKTQKGWSYTPSKTVAAEAIIRMAFVASKQKKIEGKVPLLMSIWFYRSKPKSAKKSTIYPLTRPDLDNYLKLVKDALNKFAYDDDSQIIDEYAYKRYDDVPRIEIVIKETGGTETV